MQAVTSSFYDSLKTVAGIALQNPEFALDALLAAQIENTVPANVKIYEVAVELLMKGDINGLHDLIPRKGKNLKRSSGQSAAKESPKGKDDSSTDKKLKLIPARLLKAAAVQSSEPETAKETPAIPPKVIETPNPIPSQSLKDSTTLISPNLPPVLPKSVPQPSPQLQPFSHQDTVPVNSPKLTPQIEKEIPPMPDPQLLKPVPKPIPPPPSVSPPIQVAPPAPPASKNESIPIVFQKKPKIAEKNEVKEIVGVNARKPPEHLYDPVMIPPASFAGDADYWNIKFKLQVSDNKEKMDDLLQKIHRVRKEMDGLKKDHKDEELKDSKSSSTPQLKRLKRNADKKEDGEISN